MFILLCAYPGINVTCYIVHIYYPFTLNVHTISINYNLYIIVLSIILI